MPHDFCEGGWEADVSRETIPKNEKFMGINTLLIVFCAPKPRKAARKRRKTLANGTVFGAKSSGLYLTPATTSFGRGTAPCRLSNFPRSRGKTARNVPDEGMGHESISRLEPAPPDRYSTLIPHPEAPCDTRGLEGSGTAGLVA